MLSQEPLSDGEGKKEPKKVVADEHEASSDASEVRHLSHHYLYY